MKNAGSFAPDSRPTSPTLGALRLAAFAAPGIPISAVTVPLLAYLPTLYASHAGLPLATVGAVFLIVRLVDLGLDPFLGAAMDAGRARWGRFRPWLLVGMFPLLAGVLMLFAPPAKAGATYLVVWLGVTYVAYSICYLAHLSWGSALSTDYAVRSRIFAWWQSGSLVGLILVLATPIIVQGALHRSPAVGVAAMGWLVAALLPVTFLIAVLSVSEPAAMARQPLAKPIDYLKLMLRPTIARLLAADLIIGTALGMNSALFFFYFAHAKHVPPLQITVLLFLNLCGSLVGAPVWNGLSGRLGKHRAASAAFFFYALSLVAIEIMPPGMLVASIVLFLAGITLSAGPLLLRSMMSDAGDEELLRSGHDRTGLLSALFSGTNKLGLAFAPGLTFIGLGWAHFNPTGANAPEALLMLRCLYIYAPAALGLLTAGVVIGHRLTAERHALICAQLSGRDLKEDASRLTPDF